MTVTVSVAPEGSLLAEAGTKAQVAVKTRSTRHKEKYYAFIINSFFSFSPSHPANQHAVVKPHSQLASSDVANQPISPVAL